MVGGASLAGGRGTAIGAVLGALLMQLIDNGLFIMKFPTQYTMIIVGAAIIVAAAIDQVGQYLQARRLAGARQI